MSVVKVDTYSMMRAKEKAIDAVVSLWRTSPFTRVSIRMSETSMSDRSVSIHGPSPPERSKFLP